MGKRIIISVIFIPVIILIIYAPFLNSISLFIFVLLLSFLAMREMNRLLARIYHVEERKSLIDGAFYLCGLATIIFFYIKTFFPVKEVYILYILGGLIAVNSALSRLRRINVYAQVGSFAYTVLCPLLIYMVRREEGGMFLLYALFLLAWFSDASAYFIGSFFGRTKGIVKLSPNKSLEGYAGSFVLTILLGAVLGRLFGEHYPLTGMQPMLTAFAVAVLAPMGDLMESMLKRKAGVKDSSNLLPGLGGVLDIFDSIFMSTPLYYLLIKIILNVQVS